MKTKQCQRCRVRSAIPRERYCRNCRAIVLERVRRRAHAEQTRVRTLSQRGAEQIGRPGRDPRVVAEQRD